MHINLNRKDGCTLQGKETDQFMLSLWILIFFNYLSVNFVLIFFCFFVFFLFYSIPHELNIDLVYCKSLLCLHPRNVLSLWCFYREPLLLLRFLLVGRMLVGFVLSSLCEWNWRTWGSQQIVISTPDGHTEYFDIVAGVLQGDTLAPYLFIIYVLRTSINKIWENGFELTKKRSRRYPAKTLTDADYADNIAILANTPNQAETLLHNLERAAAGIGLHVNAHKTEYMYYN